MAVENSLAGGRSDDQTDFVMLVARIRRRRRRRRPRRSLMTLSTKAACDRSMAQGSASCTLQQRGVAPQKDDSRRARDEVIPVQLSCPHPVEPSEFDHMDASRSRGPRGFASWNLLRRSWPDHDPRAVTREPVQGCVSTVDDPHARTMVRVRGRHVRLETHDVGVVTEVMQPIARHHSIVAPAATAVQSASPAVPPNAGSRR